jgi:uncharacterized protein YoxC
MDAETKKSLDEIKDAMKDITRDVNVIKNAMKDITRDVNVIKNDVKEEHKRLEGDIGIVGFVAIAIELAILAIILMHVSGQV